MILKDFIFNYKSCLISLFKKKKIVSLIKRTFLLPYKYIICILRDIFIIKNIDKLNLHESKNSLDDFLIYFGCDKSSLVHGYDKFYSSELKNLKDTNVKILEFGIHYGASQAAMCKYFKNAEIIGVDKNPYYKKFFSKKIRSLYCDVSDKNSLKLLKKHLKTEVEVIIDDASHIPSHQLKTFTEMFNILKSGGIYVIEELDIYKSYPEAYGNLENNESDLRNFLYLFKDKINLKIEEYTQNTEITKIAEKIEWVKIFRGDYIVNNQNVSEIAFIKKK